MTYSAFTTQPEPKPWQNEIVDWALSGAGRNVFAEPGLGKTRAALQTICETDGRALVVAPLLVAKNTWPAENEKWNTGLSMRVLHGKDKHIDTLPDVCVTNYENLPWLADEMRKDGCNPFQQVIYDECTKLKHPGTSRFRKMRGIFPTFDYRLGLTGTPMSNDPLNLWGIQYIVDIGRTLGSSYDLYKNNHFREVVENVWRPYPGAVERIFEAMKPTARAWRADVLDMPPLTFNRIHIEADARTREYYARIKKDSVVHEIGVYAASAGVAANKSRQMASGAVFDNNGDIVKLNNKKVSAFADLLEAQGGRPLLVVAEYEFEFDALRTLCAKVGCDYGELSGRTTASQADEHIQAWNQGELPVLAIHPMSAGYGLNLQAASHHICFYALPWSYELFRQCIGRLWRQGQTKAVIVHTLVVAESYDLVVLEKVEAKEDLHTQLMQTL